jgi:hypothetical protein
MSQKAGAAATIAIIAAIGSFILDFSGKPVWGLVTALLAIVLGLTGVVISASPKIGGGLMSSISVILGILSVGLSVLVLIGIVLF